MDPIANMITIIRNAYLTRKEAVEVPYSKLKEKIAEKLVGEGFLQRLEVRKDKKTLKISLRYEGGEPALTQIERVSKPSLRVYGGVDKIPKVLGGRGEVILSTPKGILTGAQAKKANLGGEIILKVW